ncbi:arylesterase [Hyphomicrobium sp.]|uniref:arylesterase n=1 Tax=Hyphomicrobium sp. TaxID=82 RepID=UPI002E33B5AF|nr:arylesterase [Hyphomicrobium sp.]HEX2840775.1 arylesterase [Hyphomicrobium sp.]
MKAKQSASTFVGQMVRLIAIVNLWLLVGFGAAHAADDAAPIRIVALGDSLTAGYMLKPDGAFPVQLAAALKAKGYSVDVSNAGVSGDTTAAGLERFDWAIPEGTEAVIVELGANDALRGIDPDETRGNLDTILAKLRGRNIVVLIAGMEAPKNWGKEYETRFAAIFSDLAEKHGALLYPFFLDGVALDAKLNLPDGMHPTEEGIGVIVARILPKVEELITRVRERRSALSKS